MNKVKSRKIYHGYLNKGEEKEIKCKVQKSPEINKVFKAEKDKKTFYFYL